MQRPYVILYCFVWGAILAPGVLQAQDTGIDIEAAVAAYRSGDPVEAAQRLQAILASPDAEQLPPALLARVYTYLAMSEWAMYRRPEAEAAAEAAIGSDLEAFIEYAEPWVRENPALMDFVVPAMLTRAVALYDEAEYASSVDELTRILSFEGIMSPHLAAEIRKYLAFCYVAMRKNALAQQEFRTALRLDPLLELGDDAVIAPKLRRVFLAVRRDTIRKSQRNTRRNTILRSLFIPGWGQVYRGSSFRGYGYMAAEMTLLTGMFLSIRSYMQARDRYEQFDVDDAVAIYNQRNSAEDVRRELDARYDRFRSKRTQANTMITLAVGIWAVNMIDAFILSVRHDDATVAGRDGGRVSGLAMDWDPAGRQWRMRYRLSW